MDRCVGDESELERESDAEHPAASNVWPDNCGRRVHLYHQLECTGDLHGECECNLRRGAGTDADPRYGCEQRSWRHRFGLEEVCRTRIDIRKNAEGADSQQVVSGGTATWTIRVENTGDVTLTKWW